MEEKITLTAKRKKQIKTLAALLGDVGFNRVEYERDKLFVGRVSEDLYGNLCIDYGVRFGKDYIDFTYTIDERSSKIKKRLEMLPLLFNIIIIAKSHYEINPTPLFEMIVGLLEELQGALNKETIDAIGELNELKEKYANLLKRYEEVVRASEENSRLLLEAEQKYHELDARVQQLEAMSDETLKEEVYEWIKMHDGAIDISEFAEVHSLPSGRVEEGLEMLMREGYIKKR